jgi:hypothetical protein
MPDSAWPEWSLASVLARRPAVRINQLGYLPHGPKRATWMTDEFLPIEFTVIASDGSVALRDRTRPWSTRPEQHLASLCMSLTSPMSPAREPTIRF